MFIWLEIALREYRFLSRKTSLPYRLLGCHVAYKYCCHVVLIFAVFCHDFEDMLSIWIFLAYDQKLSTGGNIYERSLNLVYKKLRWYAS